jgi:CubicO group peptidase (beta-lactamase class C family)
MRILHQALLALLVTASSGSAALAAPAASATTPSKAQPEGLWKGEVNIPGTPLAVVVTVKAGVVSVDIPAQNARGLPTENVAFSADAAAFSLVGVGARFDGRMVDDVWSGTFTQGAATFPFRLQRQDPIARAKALLKGLDEDIARALVDLRTPGVAVAIVVDGQVVLAEAFGERDASTHAKATPHTRFMIGSTTKAMTSFMLGQLVEQGRVSFDAPVYRTVPDFQLSDSRTTEVTLRDMLTHRTGVARCDLSWYGRKELTRADLFARLQHLPMSSSLRSSWEYNNFMYAMAGHVLEKVTGKSWEDNLAQRVLVPLQMEDATVSVRALSTSKDRAVAHDYVPETKTFAVLPYHDVPSMAPAGSTFSASATDMSRWLRLLVGGGTVDGKTLLSSSTMQEAMTPHQLVPGDSGDKDIVPLGYGHGWTIDLYRGHRRVHHSGGIDGFVAEVALYPDDGVGVAILANEGESAMPPVVRNLVAERLLQLPPRDWIGDFKARIAKLDEQPQTDPVAVLLAQAVPNTAPSHPLSAYAGRYLHAGFGDVQVQQEGAGLVVRVGPLTMPLAHQHYDTFITKKSLRTVSSLDGAGLIVHFVTGMSGDVDAVEIPLEPSVAAIRFARAPDPRVSDVAFLKAFEGVYDVGLPITIRVQGKGLVADVPGQRTYGLTPQGGTRFGIDGLEGGSLSFELVDGAVKSVVLAQPGYAKRGARSPLPQR